MTHHKDNHRIFLKPLKYDHVNDIVLAKLHLADIKVKQNDSILEWNEKHK